MHKHELKASKNRNVFSNFLNVAVEDAILITLGRAFHKVGAAREND